MPDFTDSEFCEKFVGKTIKKITAVNSEKIIIDFFDNTYLTLDANLAGRSVAIFGSISSNCSPWEWALYFDKLHPQEDPVEIVSMPTPDGTVMIRTMPGDPTSAKEVAVNQLKVIDKKSHPWWGRARWHNGKPITADESTDYVFDDRLPGGRREPMFLTNFGPLLSNNISQLRQRDLKIFAGRYYGFNVNKPIEEAIELLIAKGFQVYRLLNNGTNLWQLR